MAENEEEKLAQHRTRLSEDRTLMANERTFASWVGAGLGCVGIALGIQAIFRETEPTWIAKMAATVFMATAVLVFLSSRLNARRALERLESHEATPVSRKQLDVIVAILCIGALLITAILWTL